MDVLDPALIERALATYGYFVVFGVILGESAGIPLPGETVLVSAALYASTRHQLDIRLIIVSAAAGAIIGDNIGYWVGREFGGRLLARYGPRIGLTERRQLLGRYLFKRYGGAIVFFGRFAAFLRTYAALLAGANRLGFGTFLVFNAAGGIVWATIFGVGGYLAGKGIERVAGPVGYVALAAALVGAVIAWRFFKHHEERLLDQAEQAMRADAGKSTEPRRAARP